MTLKKSEEIALHKEIRSQFTFDPLRMLLCKDYQTQGGIVIRQPRIGEIIDIGEEEFYRNLNPWVTNTTSYRVALWHMEPSIDWCKITDYELFCSIYQATDPEVMKLILPDTNLLTYEKKLRVLSEDQYEMVLYSETEDQVIDTMAYLEISQYLRSLFNIFPKDEFAKGKTTKEMIIWEEEMNASKDKSEAKFKSSLFPLISACINHPGFKHGLNDLEDVGMFEFMDSVNRLQVYENTRALLSGSMSGFCDTSKIPQESFNFMRDYTVEKKKVFTEQEKEKFKQIQVR